MFDWSESASPNPSIHWAAFYSDCKHKVQKVTSGHRITLTYNLYSSRGFGMLTHLSKAMNSKQLPLYTTLKSMLANRHFMPRGGTLGIYTAHLYPYTNRDNSDLPYCLKGVDMMTYEALLALAPMGVTFKLVHVLDESEEIQDWYEDQSNHSDSRVGEKEGSAGEEATGSGDKGYRGGHPATGIVYDHLPQLQYGEEEERQEALTQDGGPLYRVRWPTHQRHLAFDRTYIAVSFFVSLLQITQTLVPEIAILT